MEVDLKHEGRTAIIYHRPNLRRTRVNVAIEELRYFAHNRIALIGRLGIDKGIVQEIRSIDGHQLRIGIIIQGFRQVLPVLQRVIHDVVASKIRVAVEVIVEGTSKGHIRRLLIEKERSR